MPFSCFVLLYFLTRLYSLNILPLFYYILASLLSTRYSHWVLRLCHISTCFADMYIPSIRRILEIPPLGIFPFSLVTEAFAVTSPLMRSLYQFNYVTIVNSIEEVFEFRRLLSLVESYDPITICKKFLLVLKILNILRLVRFLRKKTSCSFRCMVFLAIAHRSLSDSPVLFHRISN